MATKETRETRLLLILSQQANYKTAEELAAELEISVKTIYRLIKKINDQTEDGPLILSEKGRGYRLDSEKYLSQSKSFAPKSQTYSPMERRRRVIGELLLAAPNTKKVYDLFEDYYLSESAISTDEQWISEALKEFDLELVRRQRTLSIIGQETNIRQAMMEFVSILQTVDLDELQNSVNTKLNHYDVQIILKQLSFIEEQLKITIPYPYDVNIFSHLYILISRTRSQGYKQTEQQLQLTELEQQELLDNQEISIVARNVIEHLNRYLHLELLEIEVYYVYQYLVSSRMQGDMVLEASFPPRVIDITTRYLTEMTTRLNFEEYTESIFLDLANHIKPLLNRLDHGIKVKNGLLDEIKISYPKVFQQVTEVSKDITQSENLSEITSDENGFLTLYFARMMETSRKPIRTLIMCTTGIGTSELLRIKIAKKFPELDILNVSASRFPKRELEKFPNVELILTTVQLSDQLPVDTLIVSAMLTMDDQSRIRKKLEEIMYGR